MTLSSKQSDNKKRSFKQKLMVVLNVLIGCLLILAAKASLISPEKWAICSYPNYLLTTFFFINIAFVAYWLANRPVWVLFPLVCLLLSWPNFKSWLPIHLSEPARSLGKEIKVLSYNTMQFGKYQAHTKNSPNDVLHYLSHSQADIICLQEAGFRFITQQDILSAMKSYRYKKNFPAGRSQYSRLWVFSNYPILKAERIKLNSNGNGAFFCDIDVSGTRLRVVNCHLESNKLTSKDKGLYREIIDHPGKETLINLAETIGGKVSSAAVLRTRQAETIAQLIDSSPYPLIVCGDFNDVPNSYTHRLFSRRLIDAWGHNATGFGVTFHEHFLFRIDYIFHSPELISYQTSVDRSIDASDHYPIWTYLQVP